MARGAPISGSNNGHIYSATAVTTRPLEDYTIRITPARAGVEVPAELALISWQK
jgi:starch phosphorylase